MVSDSVFERVKSINQFHNHAQKLKVKISGGFGSFFDFVKLVYSCGHFAIFLFLLHFFNSVSVISGETPLN